MPRKPRFFLPDVPVHIVQRGHSRAPVFFEDGDYQAYKGWLGEAAERYDCTIRAPSEYRQSPDRVIAVCVVR